MSSALVLRSKKGPLDMAGLRAHCRERVAAGQAAETVDLLLDLVESLAERVDRLEQQLARLSQEKWGRRSEQLCGAQLHLALLEAPPVVPLLLPPLPADSPASPAKKPARKPLRQIPAHIPRITTISEPCEQAKRCADCGGDKALIGSEAAQVLEWEPGGFRVEVTERRKYACRACQSGVVIGPGPDRVLDGAMPGPGLISEVIVRKIKDHCPLERQSRIFSERFGVPLSPSTLGDWIAGGAEVLRPLSQRIRTLALKTTHLSLDDTPVRVLDKGHEKGVKRGRLWSFVSDGPLCFYEYTPNWKGGPIRELLTDFRGTLQSDGFSGLDPLYRKDCAPARAGCMAHARRKFHKAFLQGDLRAAGPLLVIKKLYEVERQAKQEHDDDTDRRRRRLAQSVPLFAALREQLEALALQAPPKTPLGQALTYALRQWETLQVYLQDGALHIDDNHTERTLRPIAIGRKNWLFAGSDEGAHRLAVLYTLVSSCELAGLRDPWAYLRDVLTKLSRGWPHARIDDLLPLHWKAALPAS
jgi:transposase